MRQCSSVWWWLQEDMEFLPLFTWHFRPSWSQGERTSHLLKSVQVLCISSVILYFSHMYLYMQLPPLAMLQCFLSLSCTILQCTNAVHQFSDILISIYVPVNATPVSNAAQCEVFVFLFTCNILYLFPLQKTVMLNKLLLCIGHSSVQCFAFSYSC